MRLGLDQVSSLRAQAQVEEIVLKQDDAKLGEEIEGDGVRKLVVISGLRRALIRV